MSVLIRAMRGLAAAVALVLLLVVPPWLLVTVIGNPWPDEGVSLMAPLTDTAFIGLIAAVAWLAWAQLAVVIVIEAVRAARGIGLPERAGVIGGQQRLVRSLIATVAAAIVISGTGSAHATNSHQSADGPQIIRHTQAAAVAATSAADDKIAEHTTITVRAGDSLWGLAITHLGDGQRWHEIANLNTGRTMPDGHRFSPNHLRPGWQLRIPAEADDAIRPVANHTEAGRQVRVRSGDTLSSIAATHLGDPNRWPELMRLNRGATQMVGGRLSDPDQLRPGWVLRLPDNGHGANDGDKTGHVGGHQRDSRLLEPMDKRTAAEVRLEPPANDTKSDNSTGGSPRRNSNRQEADPDPQQHPAVQSSQHDASTDASPEAATSPNEDETVFDAPWILAGLTGAGVLLAGSLFIGLRQRRRAQFRNRRPGRGIAKPDADLAPTEMTIAAAGTASAVIVEHMEAVLRRLAAATHASHEQMPPLASVELSAQRVTLHLSEPRALADPWMGTPDQTHWHVDVATDLNDIGPTPDHSEPPYPQLVTVGEGDEGTLWLLNCEELGTVTVTGDPDRCRDFARHLTTQLAVNPWSASVQVDCVGLAAEADGLNDRVRYHEYDMADRAASNALTDAVATVDRTAEYDTDVSTGRAGGIGDEAWPSRILVWDGDLPHSRELTSLADLVQTQCGRAATSIVLTGTVDDIDGFEIRVTADGRVVLEHAGLDLAAVGLTEDEARGCALLYAQSELVDDVAVPVPDAAAEGWETYSDLAGGLRPEHTLPRHSPTVTAGDAQTSSLLAAADDAYVDAAAILPEDLQTLAPRVPDDVRTRVENEDPCLDDDIADLADPNCDRPRLSLLGPVEARTHGKALTKRKPYFTEVLAFLALHRTHGVTSDELCEAFGVSPATAHNYIKTVRAWLGANPRTGQWHLPHADKSPAAHARGISVYQVDDGLLVDTDLFKRLRLRGQARGGQEGSRDLARALDLVRGRPFDQLRPGGWTWLINGERHDQYMTVAVADAGVTIATDCLERGDLPRARAAAELAVLAAPAEEHTRLCLARVHEADGDQAAADRIIRTEVCNRSDDGGAPAELSDRTKAIIRERQWLAS